MKSEVHWILLAARQKCGYLDAHLWSRLLSAEPATFHGTSFLIEQTTARFSKKWTKWAWRKTSDMAEIKFLELLWSPPWAWELPIPQAFGFEIGGIANEWRNVANVRTGFLPKLQPKQRVCSRTNTEADRSGQLTPKPGIKKASKMQNSNTLLFLFVCFRTCTKDVIYVNI